MYLHRQLQPEVLPYQMKIIKSDFFWIMQHATNQKTIVKTIQMEGIYKKTASVVSRITFTNWKLFKK
jgi:hypothetical protein